MEDKKQNTSVPEPAGQGNASNPSLNEAGETGTGSHLSEKAGTYIREAGNIEDMPDEKDVREMDEVIKKHS